MRREAARLVLVVPRRAAIFTHHGRWCVRLPAGLAWCSAVAASVDRDVAQQCDRRQRAALPAACPPVAEPFCLGAEHEYKVRAALFSCGGNPRSQVYIYVSKRAATGQGSTSRTRRPSSSFSALSETRCPQSSHRSCPSTRSRRLQQLSQSAAHNKD